jgi:hypothetical protein
MRILIAILTIVFLLCLVSLALLNAHEEVHLTLGTGGGMPTWSIALPWVLVGATLAGVFFMGLISVLEGLHLRLANGRLRRQLHRLQEELDELRSLPLRESVPSPTPPSPPGAPSEPAPRDPA